MLRFATRCCMTVCCVGAIAAGVPGGATAHTGDFAKFNQCPSTTTGVRHCLYSVTNKGKVVLGNKNTPIVNPVTLQGGYSVENEEGYSKFYAASNGETLSKTPQPVPGGLAGLVPPEEAPLLVKEAIKFFFENGLTGVNATLELAKPASEIELNNVNLEIGEGTALKLPVKVHLENPFLGSKCYVGSSSSPIIWNLTSGTTSPPPPNEAITGKPGFVTIKDNFEIAELTENELVENAWSAPGAKGCGGFLLELLVDPIIDVSLGNTTAGHNTAVLENTIDTATVGSVNKH
jgi:hypothetical protein